MPSKPEGTFSVIDLGTNTCLLLIANIQNNKLTRLFEAQKTPGLGKELYRTGRFSTDSFYTVTEIFRKYIVNSKEYGSERIFAFGTCALREAKNSSQFIKFIESETGIKIDVITGEDEAAYGFEGAVFDLKSNEDLAVVDIGGGSTEVSFIEDEKLKTISLKIGSVRLFEEIFKGIFSPENITKARSLVKKSLLNAGFDNIRTKELVGVAGTVTSLSALKNRLESFYEDKIHRDKLTLIEIEDSFQSLIAMTSEERLSLGSFMAGRNDIIICGTLILIEVMTYFDFKTIIVSTKGLRYGLMLNIADFTY